MPSTSYLERVKTMLKSRDPKVRDMVQRANEALLNCKLLGPSSVHNDATLSNVSIQYANEELIGTKLMPVVNVPQVSGYYFTYGQRDRRSGPDDNVGTRGTPKEISESRSAATYSCTPYALKNFIDDRTLRAADAPLNEMVDLVASVNEVMALKEEQRIATVLTTSGNFHASNTVALAAAEQWNSASGGDPLDDILTAVDAIEMGSGNSKLVGFCDVTVWRVLAKHAAILDLFKNVSAGLATPKMVAGFFGLDDILVGRARTDTANEGQTAVKGRAWGECFGIVRVANAPSIRSASFGYTLRFGEKATTQWYDPGVGISGGYYARVGIDEDHKVVANDCGYLITNPLA